MNRSINSATDLAFEVAKQTEAKILEQLNDFVSRKLIVIEHGPMGMYHDPISNKIKVEGQVTLRLKDKEYIESLERQVQELQTIVKQLRSKS